MQFLIRFFTALFALLLAGASWAGEALLAPRQLQPLVEQQQVRVIDVREAPAYAEGHIPGAVSAPYGRWRGPASNPGQVPELPALTALVRELGLTPAQPTVIVHAGTDSTDFGAAARVYWTLKSLGARELSILNGGLAAWKQAGLPLASAPAQVAASDWQPRWDARWTSTTEQVRAGLDRKGTVLVDARPADFFEGRRQHAAARTAGTLPGAINLDNARFFEPGGATLLDGPVLATRAAPVPDDAGQQTVAFCNTGHWAATEWFVLSEVLGRRDVTLYPGSMVEWSQSAQELPVANAPSRLDQLRQGVQGWVSRNLTSKAQ